ncbi:hypothetical protein [Prosthecobacter vanneervenii]|uniref:Uncharacterized protein n=1 Tax=Prosthecobacter vanneervenii TaxID=48466 RepID=A0A7W8DJ08_9BACT|nr:hypothetical protein [Prosthecobacter vanneervenii]MBB5031535.1 hypothetical protein [Prosthecobacter vanneervenii]
MGLPTKVRIISRKASEHWYSNLPSAIAQAMEFTKGETVEWIIADKGHLILARKEVPANPVDIQKIRHGLPERPVAPAPRLRLLSGCFRRLLRPQARRPHARLSAVP